MSQQETTKLPIVLVDEGECDDRHYILPAHAGWLTQEALEALCRRLLGADPPLELEPAATP